MRQNQRKVCPQNEDNMNIKIVKRYKTLHKFERVMHNLFNNSMRQAGSDKSNKLSNMILLPERDKRLRFLAKEHAACRREGERKPNGRGRQPCLIESAAAAAAAAESAMRIVLSLFNSWCRWVGESEQTLRISNLTKAKVTRANRLGFVEFWRTVVCSSNKFCTARRGLYLKNCKI